MANPFTSIVGLKSVTSPVPAVLVNDLTGISTELVSALSNADSASATTVWAKIQRNAYTKLSSMIEGELSKSADFQFEFAHTTPPQPGESLGLVSISSVLQGMALAVPYQEYTAVQITELRVWSMTAGPVATTAYLYNLTSGELISSQPVSIPFGYTVVPVSFTIPPRFGGLDLYVGIDASGLTIQELGGASASWSNSDSAYVLTPGVLPSTGYHNRGAFTPGNCRVWVNASVSCSLPDVIARYTDRLLWAYANICGSLLMAEKLGSSNVNLFTNTNRTFTEDREAKFMDEAMMLVKPVCRTMIRELAQTPVLINNDTGPFDAGYCSVGFV